MSAAGIDWNARYRDDELFVERWVASGRRIPRIGIFIVAYNHVNFLPKTLQRIPRSVIDVIEEIFIFDDASRDSTYLVAEGFKQVYNVDKITVHRNASNLGYGGNQKAGYAYAVERGLDYVILLHGDGQYAPEALPSMIRPVLEQGAQVVFGSRMIVPGEALRGGMPLYKYLGNRILTGFENLMTGMSLYEYHSGYRLYSVEVLRQLPLHLNTDDFHFDTEIILQVNALGVAIHEVPMPSYYGEEICYVNGMKYAWDVTCAATQYALFRFGLREDGRFADISAEQDYPVKNHPLSSHSRIVSLVPSGSRVLDLGCGQGAMLPSFIARGCRVTGVDMHDAIDVDTRFDAYVTADLDAVGRLPFDDGSFDAVVLADIIEHVRRPDLLLAEARRLVKENGTVVASTGNIALFLYRLLLLFGAFPYSRRGILDKTHVHLYTFSSFSGLLRRSGFSISTIAATPIPFETLIAGASGRMLSFAYYPLARLWPSLFGYQCVIMARPSAPRRGAPV